MLTAPLAVFIALAIADAVPIAASTLMAELTPILGHSLLL